MNWLLKYSVLILLLLAPLTASSNTSVLWQNTAPSLTSEQEIKNGSFIVPFEDSIMISTNQKSGSYNNVSEAFIISQTEFAALQVLLFETNSQTLTGQYPVANIDARYTYKAAVGHPLGVIIIGGYNGESSSNKVNLIHWSEHKNQLNSYFLPSLPVASSSPAAVILDNFLYVLTGSDSDSRFYRLDLSLYSETSLPQMAQSVEQLPNQQTQLNNWQQLPSLPFIDAAVQYRNGVDLVVQNNGKGNKIYALGGYFLATNSNNNSAESRIDIKGEQHYLSTNQQLWQYQPNHPTALSAWQHKGSIKIDDKELRAGIDSAVAIGQSHILAFADNGQSLSYNAITNSWVNYQQNVIETGSISEKTENLRAMQSVWLNKKLYILAEHTDNSGQSQLWQVTVKTDESHFGWVNMTVLIVYLLLVVLVGVFFMFKNKNTEDYFRGGQSIPWWAAACSIYATMLSSLTYVALPAIVYQTDWLLLIGIWMIIVVAPIAIYIAMPFFRQIDATSAYEYLSKRFNMSVRLFASGLFTLFHIGRMGIVMALTALALSAVTPLSASDSVLLMGVLCLIYCTLGGIEAVIWTDTLQTLVLIVGAITCFVTIVMGLDGGLTDLVEIGLADNKFTMVNNDFSLESITTLSIWVIVLGGIGQNLSSYTADQAVVQRYMVTSDMSAARKSIWANAAIAGPGALLFFCIGTGLYAFYQLHPEKLDPMIQIDQIFPIFIATELPVGIAGLIVAGIFAAAQSTVSTSMNSIATTLVTDFIKPFNLVKTEKGYMSAARWLTFIMGTLGTLAGLIFINPEIRSLMEEYFKVIGMFMGALGGLFVLGVMTKRANSTGAIIGILSGVLIMISAWQLGWANGYLYATIGITSCLIIGYFASLCFARSDNDLHGLTLYTMHTIDSTPVKSIN